MWLDVSYPLFTARLGLLSDTRMAFEIAVRATLSGMAMFEPGEAAAQTAR